MSDRCEVCTHHSHGECYVEAVQHGAAMAFGLMGMATAIRQTHWRLLSTFLTFDEGDGSE